nr:putative transcription elongation factor SPT5 homolog 1 [Tanacetum cinerariifolium]
MSSGHGMSCAEKEERVPTREVFVWFVDLLISRTLKPPMRALQQNLKPAALLQYCYCQEAYWLEKSLKDWGSWCKVQGNPLASRVAHLTNPSQFPNYPAGRRHRGRGRGADPLAGTFIKIRLDPWKGYKGRVVDASGTTVRIELKSHMKVVTVELEA